MKLVTFEIKTPLGLFQRLGAWTEAGIVDLNHAYATRLAQQGEAQIAALANIQLPPQMLGFLQAGDRALRAALETLSWFETQDLKLGWNKAQLLFSPDEVSLLSPLPNPNSLRDFITFETHVRAGSLRRGMPDIPKQWYDRPIYYKGNHRTIIAPDATVIWPSFTQKLDYELELACIIGKEGRNIPREEAHHYIAGYAILNDFSARDIQREEMACMLGPSKGKDFATGLGPWLVTRDEIQNPRDLLMTAHINGEEWSRGNAGESHWTFEQIISYVSQDETLYPGDILGSGTVGSGCGLDLGRWLQPNDVIELSIEGLGVLRNLIGQPRQKEE